MPERAYADIMGNFRRGYGRQRSGAGDYEGAMRADPDNAETYAGLADRQRQSRDREMQQGAQRTYAQALAGGNYEDAENVAAKVGDVEGVTGARAAQQDVTEQQRVEAWRELRNYRNRIGEIAQSSDPQTGYAALIAEAREQSDSPDMVSFLDRLPPTWDPGVQRMLDGTLQTWMERLLTPQQLATMEIQREERDQQGWSIDANGRTYRNRGGVIERRGPDGAIVQDTAPVPVPADRVDARRPEDDGVDARGERDLRREFDARQGNFRLVRDSYASINNLVSSPASAAGDISLIFAYMKILDPTSVVREQEQANAQNAAGVPDQIRNTYNQLLTGQRLNPRQRQDFANQARSLYQTRERQFTRDAEEYRRLAEDYGYDPSRVVLDDQTFDDAAPGSGGGAGALPAEAQRVRGQRYPMADGGSAEWDGSRFINHQRPGG
jgi:hypothetical protein